ncbi:MAG TPA: hypothetical protein VH796_11855 [Nitrososphaeraceae archaeon]
MEPIDPDSSLVLDEIIKEIKKEFKIFLAKRKDLIIRLGQAFERTVSDNESICEEIKNALREEITQKLISIRDIERYCPNKWKRKTRPKKKIDNTSISEEIKQDTPELLVQADGSTVIESTDVTNSGSNNDDDVNSRSNFGTECVHDGPPDIQLNETDESSSPTSSNSQILEQDEIKESETKIARPQYDLELKSNENDDRFIDVQFEISFEELRHNMSSLYRRNSMVAEVLFTAKFDLARKELTEIQIVDADGLE